MRSNKTPAPTPKFPPPGISDPTTEEVRNHEYRDGDLWLNVLWAGYPTYPDERAMVRFADSHWSPTVKAYVATHHLPPLQPAAAPAARAASTKGRKKGRRR